MTFRIGRAGGPAGQTAELLDWGPTIVSQHSLHDGVLSIADDQARSGNDSYQMTKLPLDLCKIGEDVCMIELDVVQDDRLRPIVDELRALIEKGGVIFVALDHKQARWRQAGRDREVAWDAPDQKAWGAPRVLEDPCQHRRSRRFPVGSRDSEHPLIYQNVLFEPLRA